ncbi:MAG: DUF2157 domain-containing protein [Vicinamibacterales bacterium]
MTTLERLADWSRRGTITEEQQETLAALVRRERFSLYLELNALLYLGVLSIAGGVGWTVRTYFTNLGDAAIILSLTGILAGCFYYCVSRADPYSSEEVESPTLAFDYVLYLACVVLGIELGYLETRFALLREAWNYYVLASAVIYFSLAYRFDNRLVLSLALSTLAAWFGLSLTLWGYGSADSLRLSAITYGLVVGGLGAVLRYRELKPHFFETYLHLAATVLFVALLSGVDDPRFRWVYLAALVGLGVIAILGGVQYRRFAFVGYGIVFAYLGISFRLLLVIGSATLGMFYGVVSATAVLVLLVYLARQFARED